MQNKNIQNILLLFGVFGLLAGAYGIYEALVYGGIGTGLTSPVPWGLGVVTYLYFLGLSGGGLLIAVLSQVWGKKELSVFSGLAAWCVVVCEVCAGIAIVIDLGHWERMYGFIVFPNFQSPMAWMFVFFTALLIIYFLKILSLIRGNSVKAHSLTWISIPVAFLFYATNGYIFGMLSAQPLWGGAFTPIWFVLAALLSGGALVGLVAWGQGFSEQHMQNLGVVLLRLLIMFLVFEVLYIITIMQSGDTEAIQGMRTLLWGSGALSFWGIHILVGVLVPAFMLYKSTCGCRVGLASLLIVLAFLAARWNFVIPAQVTEALPGLNAAFQHARLASSYAPSLGEWLITLFVISLCLVALLLGPRIAPVLFSKEGENHV